MAEEIPSGDGTTKQVVAALMIHNEVIGASYGKSGRYAKIRAAHNAVDVLDRIPPHEFRAKFRCDCEMNDDAANQESLAVNSAI